MQYEKILLKLALLDAAERDLELAREFFPDLHEAQRQRVINLRNTLFTPRDAPSIVKPFRWVRELLGL